MFLMFIGKYQSDMAYTGHYFNGSITFYGDGTNGNIYCCSKHSRVYDKNVFINFIIKNIKYRLDKYNFIFYNQGYAYEVINKFPECKEHILNINSRELLDWLSNKTLVRVWAQNLIDVPSFCTVTGSECTFSNFKKLFPQENEFVIQDNYSSGGLGSFIIKKDQNMKANILNPCNIYLVSPLLKNSYSINIHILVGKFNQIIFSPSIQIIDPNQSPLIFRGSDYIEAQKIPKLIINNLYNCTKKIGNKLGKMNYRGICGLDFIVQNNKLYFIEINPRFQGSSFLINRTLFENNLPSLYELNEMAFSNEPIKIEKKKLENLNINYSYYKIKYSKNIAVEYFNKLCNCKDIDKYFMDGLNIQNNIQLRGYMFRFISKRNIISLNPNHQINIYQNLLSNEIIRCSIKSNMDWNNLKTALLLQGIKIDISAMIALTECGGIQEGTFDAIDIRFSNDLIVNCPLKIPFIDFSPFTLKYIEKNFYLFYLEKNISIVYVDKKDSIPNVKTHSGLLYSKMVQRNNMRIRIRHNSICLFKQNGKGCHFCHAKNEEYYNFDLDDITESFLFYLENFEFKEIMIGGASNDRIYEPTLIKDILKIIRIHTDKPIYIMSLPPQDLNDIQEYKKLGANEIAFNLEIYDETISKEIMPGKGMISRNEYLKALQKAVEVFGNDGQVRSMLIVGLEPLESFKKGIEALCKIGVSPMISPFRPMQNTKLANYVPPNFEECKQYINTAIEITKKYNIKLGPPNIYNQNNTFNPIDI